MVGIDPGSSSIEGKRAYHWATAAIIFKNTYQRVPGMTISFYAFIYCIWSIIRGEPITRTHWIALLFFFNLLQIPQENLTQLLDVVHCIGHIYVFWGECGGGGGIKFNES